VTNEPAQHRTLTCTEIERRKLNAEDNLSEVKNRSQVAKWTKWYEQ